MFLKFSTFIDFIKKVSADTKRVSNNRQSSKESPDMEFHNHYSITNIATLFKLIRIRWEEHVANMTGMCLYITDADLCRRG